MLTSQTVLASVANFFAPEAAPVVAKAPKAAPAPLPAVEIERPKGIRLPAALMAELDQITLAVGNFLGCVVDAEFVSDRLFKVTLGVIKTDGKDSAQQGRRAKSDLLEILVSRRGEIVSVIKNPGQVRRGVPWSEFQSTRTMSFGTLAQVAAARVFRTMGAYLARIEGTEA